MATTSVSSITTPPGPKGNFLFGNIQDYAKDPMGFTRRCADEYGDTVVFKGALFSGAQFNHPDHIEEILVSQRDCFVKDQALSILRLILGKGLLTSEGDFWQHQRRLMQPAFHRERITAYGKVMIDYTTHLLDTWKTGEVYDVHQEMMRLTVQIAAKTLFDADVTNAAPDIENAMQVTIEYFGLRSTHALLFFVPDWVPTPSNLRFRRVAKQMQSMISGFVAERRAVSEDKLDLLSMLLQARDDQGNPMSDQQLQHEMMTLLVAGHESTANAMAWTLHLLAQHPDVELQLLSELQAVLGGEPPTVADYQRLPFTMQVIKESLRMYPPAWAMGRTVTQPCEIGGVQLQPGNFVFISPWIVHHDARFFDNPDAFMPQRWSAEFEKQLPTCAYFPFGGGPRVCIGQAFAMMELVLVLATIVQQFRFKPLPEQSIELWGAFTLRPKHGIKMEIVRR